MLLLKKAICRYAAVAEKRRVASQIMLLEKATCG